jgi:hypothetical protein
VQKRIDIQKCMFAWMMISGLGLVGTRCVIPKKGQSMPVFLEWHRVQPAFTPGFGRSLMRFVGCPIGT